MKTESMIANTERIEQSIDLWSRCYMVTLKTERAFKRRLNELNTWDNCNGNSYEHNVKVQALQRLLGK